MSEVIEYRLDNTFDTAKEYFFSFLTGRFDLATNLWQEALEKRFNKKFEPIWIMSAKQNTPLMREKNNFVILNTLIREKFKDLEKENHLSFQEEPDDLNTIFSNSSFIKELINNLSERQDRIFILSWTNSFFEISNKKVYFLGPDPEVSKFFDSKANQVNMFNDLDLPRNEQNIYDNFEEVCNNIHFPIFLSANYSSGGFENGPIRSIADLEKFKSSLRNKNKIGKFIVSKFIKDIKHSPNVNVIVSNGGEIEVVCITDQILRNSKYLGNMYPTKIGQKMKEKIINVSKKVGKYMFSKGFKGLFGLDFVIDSVDNLFIVDVNPRRQGGYLCNVLMNSKINLIEIEFRIALGDKVHLPKYEDFQVNFVWGHTKLKPYYDFIRIVKEETFGKPIDPFINPGLDYFSIFYPEGNLYYGGCAGYLITSGADYSSVLKHLIEKSEKLVSINFGLYEV